MFNIFTLIFKLLFFRVIVCIKVFGYWICEIVLITIFSRIILKTQIYKHHLISIIAIIISCIVMNCINLWRTGITLQDIAANFFAYFFYSLSIVLKKYAMEYFFCSEYEIQ